MIGLILVGGAVFLAVKNTKKVKSVNISDSYSKYDSLFQSYGAAYGIDWKLLKRIGYVESTLGKNPSVARGIVNPNDVNGSKSSDGKSWGLMQVTLVTAQDYDKTATAVKLNNPDYSIRISAQHFKTIMRYFTNERDIVMAYNQGQGNQLKFVALEKSATLKTDSYLAARQYWEKYKRAKEMFK